MDEGMKPPTAIFTTPPHTVHPFLGLLSFPSRRNVFSPGFAGLPGRGAQLALTVFPAEFPS